MEEVLALERRLATPRPLKEGVDGALEAENERRLRPLLLLEQGDEDNEESGQEEHVQPPLTEVEVQEAATGEEAYHGTESEVQETGASEEEGRPLAAFIEQITARIQDTILGSPPPASARAPRGAATPVRRSVRLALGPNVGVPIETVAWEAVARRLGSLPPSATFTERLLQAYLALFDGPLSDLAVQAIEDLILTIKKTKKELPVRGAGVGRHGVPLPVV